MDAAAASRCRAAGCSSITLHDSVMLLHHAAVAASVTQSAANN